MANGLVERRRWDFFSCAIFFGPESDHCLVLSVCQSPFLSKICQSFYMDFSKLLHGFVKIDTWISLSCYMDLSKLMHGFL